MHKKPRTAVKPAPHKNNDSTTPQAQKRLRNVEGFLLRLRAKNQITDAELNAAIHYVRDFMLAQMQGHYARVHYESIGSQGTSPAHANDNYTPSEQQIAARQRLHNREKFLGPMAAAILYYVLGLGMSIQDFAHRLGQGKYLGVCKKINNTQANGLLLGAIARLGEI